MVGNYRLRYQAIKLLIEQAFIYFKLLKIHPTVPETQTLWGTKVIRLSNVTLRARGSQSGFVSGGRVVGPWVKLYLRVDP